MLLDSLEDDDCRGIPSAFAKGLRNELLVGEVERLPGALRSTAFWRRGDVDGMR